MSKALKLRDNPDSDHQAFYYNDKNDKSLVSSGHELSSICAVGDTTAVADGSIVGSKLLVKQRVGVNSGGNVAAASTTSPQKSMSLLTPPKPDQKW